MSRKTKATSSTMEDIEAEGEPSICGPPRIDWKHRPDLQEALMNQCFLNKYHVKGPVTKDVIGQRIAAALNSGPFKDFPNVDWPAYRKQYTTLVAAARKQVSMGQNLSALPPVDQLPVAQQIARTIAIHIEKYDVEQKQKKEEDMKRKNCFLLHEHATLGTPLAADENISTSSSSSSSSANVAKKPRPSPTVGLTEFEKLMERAVICMEERLMLDKANRRRHHQRYRVESDDDYETCDDEY